MNMEWTAGNIHAWPLHTDDVETTLCWVISAEDGTVSLTVTIHLNLEASCNEKHK